LRNVDLSHNAIQLLPANVFRNLMNLDKLDISSNRIAEVEADALRKNQFFLKMYSRKNEFLEN
jgi:Leucine-rich repeat (LRR) protein